MARQIFAPLKDDGPRASAILEFGVSKSYLAGDVASRDREALAEARYQDWKERPK